MDCTSTECAERGECRCLWHVPKGNVARDPATGRLVLRCDLGGVVLNGPRAGTVEAFQRHRQEYVDLGPAAAWII